MTCEFCGAEIARLLLHMMECPAAQQQLPVDTGVARRVRRTDPDTSRAAAEIDRARDRDRSYAALLRAGDRGLTDFELGAQIGRQQTSAGKRRGELRDAGLVVDSGARRRAPSGSGAIVWRARKPSEQ